MQVARGYIHRVHDQRMDRVVAEAFEQHHRGATQRTANLIAAIINYTRPRPKSPVDPSRFIPESMGGEATGRSMSKERYDANWERHLERTGQTNGE